MNFNKHLNLKNSHAIFGASKSAWLRYDAEKMEETYRAQYRTALGTELHDFAASEILLGHGHKKTSINVLKDVFETYLFRKYFVEETKDTSDYAKKLLRHICYLPKEAFEATKAFIGDAVGFRMTPEQPLAYSVPFYGTADAISFRNRILRIHDLKTGSTATHMEQLEIYVALFCLEYNIKPADISIELRIYQLDQVICHTPTVEDILPIMDKMITFTKTFERISVEED